MMRLRLLWVSLISLVALCSATSSTGSKVLVILEPTLKKDSFSTFFGGLEARGYQLTIREPKADAPLLVQYDVPQFSHVIFFAPTTKSFPEDLSNQVLLSLLQKKVNLLVALSPSVTPLHSFAAEFGLILPPPNSQLISHFPPRTGAKTVLPISIPSDSQIISSKSSAILFSGINFALGSNPNLIPIISATPESFATDTNKDEEADVLIEASERGGEGLWAGSSMGVVAGFQTKSGARVVWAGGVDMFNNDFVNVEVERGVKSGNAGVAQDLAKWAFQEGMVLRIDSISHHKVGETESKEHYTTNDQVTFSAHISRYEPNSSKWLPHSGVKDLQLEFAMLDPFIRTSLLPEPGAPGTYSATFRVPDRHGVFKFIIDHKRQGWTHLFSSTTVAVVPPRHDEYPRFLSAAWPYYTGAISTSLAFVWFSALWLGGTDKSGKKKAE